MRKLLVPLGWAAFGWMNATLIYLGVVSEGGAVKLSYPRVVLWQCAGWMMWALLTPLVVRLARRRPPLVMHILAAIVFPLIRIAGLFVVTQLIQPWGPNEHPVFSFARYLGMLTVYLPIDIFVYCAIVGAVMMLRASRVETQLAQAQLANLRLQLQPHFLFNTLHAIASLVRDEDSKGAVKMIAGLSDLLRYSLDTAACNFVPLSEEIEIVGRYLDIQQTRFSDRLRVAIHIDDEVRNAAVPTLFLQPLVENAIRHGIADPTRGGRLEMSARRENGSVVVEIFNDGPPLPDDWQKHQGVGLTSTRQRLAQLYGEQGQLALSNHANGVMVQVRIPEMTCAS